ncbi:protein kinase domain-containing protein [Candidatus Leptofilum sp.]|uniref:protein kinase domain-containing protein n=1 Tax=Candidatus Leptofilum sp. TaxID=3241576 RepID=UPI003B591699
MHLKASLFGTPRFERDGQPYPIGRRKVVALLAFLAHSGQPHTREYLATLLWPEYDQSGALKNLRRDLGRLKRFVGDTVLEADRLQIGLTVGETLWVDAAVFQAHLQTVENHNHPSETLCPDCAATLAEAVDIFSGDFMSGFNLPDCPEFDEWQFFEREALRQKLGDALQKLIRWHTAVAEFEKSIEYGRRWLSLDSLHEPAHRELMQLYAWAGQHSAALRQYETCVRLLQEELGVEPEPETDALYELIKQRNLPPPPEVETALATPTTLAPTDRYSITEPLKHGGHAELYLGHDQLQDQPIVIKQIRPELLNSSEAYVTRFKREAEALQQLNHPNIVAMLDIFEMNGKQTIVMEYMPGGSLRDLLIRNAPLAAEQVLDIALELADALSRAHHLGIIHRDLKPGNVLLAADGTPRLADFGIARLERDNVRLTPTGSILGSPAYMSPEALRGKELDTRSDIWSFGIILYELLAGKRPFPGDQLTAIMINILNNPVPIVADELPDLPAGLAPLLQQMLVKEREDRIPSMRQVAAELEAIRAGTWQPTATPLTAPAATPKPALPTPATPFVGREHELQAICHLLTEQSECRILTIVGTGGSGKTRLALAAAEQVQATFTDGTYFVPLAAATAPEEIPIIIAETMGISLSGSDAPEQQLLRVLQAKNMLLLLDNFEHLLSGVPLLIQLLQSAPNVKILATSRERLQLAGEQVYALHGLDVPEVDTVVSNESHSAITLFLQHVNLVRHSTAVQLDEWADVVRICQLVQGMPLALVLAAGWANMLSFAEIGDEIAQSLDFLETELHDLPLRQRSMRAVFDSSWKRLTAKEADVLPRLALFSGGFTREAAQKICGANLRVLRQLANRSLLSMDDQQRYWLHELLRQYAIERLPTNESEPLHTHFATFFADFMNQQAFDVQRAAYQSALDKIATEQGNLTQAWEWLVTACTELPNAVGLAEVVVTSHPATEETLHLLTPFIESWQFYYYLKGPMITALDFFLDGLNSLETAVSQPSIQNATTNLYRTIIANLQTKAAYFSFGLGNYQQVDELLTKSVPWLKETDNQSLLAFAYNCWAKASVLRGQRDLAREQLTQALAHAKLPEDYFIQADALKVLGVVAVDAGDYDLAHARYQESLALFREQNFAPGLTMLLHNIGTAYSRQEEHKLALDAYQEALGYAREAGFTRLEMECIGAIGGTYRTLGEFKKSEAHLQRSIAIATTIGERRVLASMTKNLGITYLEVGNVLKAKRTLKSALAQSWATETVPDALSTLSAYARVMASQGQLEQALTILLFVKAEDRVRQIDIDSYQPIVEELMAELPPDFVARAEQSATKLTLPNLVNQII